MLTRTYIPISVSISMISNAHTHISLYKKRPTDTPASYRHVALERDRLARRAVLVLEDAQGLELGDVLHLGGFG